MIQTAERMHGKKDYGLAIIAAHIGCEIAATRVFSTALQAQNIDYLDEPLSDFLNGFNLASDRNLPLFNAVTKLGIQKQPFWADFKASSKIRNDLVHTIRVATETESRSSLDAATGFVKFLLGPEWIEN